MSTGASVPLFAAALAASLLAACGGGDPLPAGSAGPGATVAGPPEPSPPTAEPPGAPSAPDVTALRLDGVTVQPPFRLSVTRRAEPGGDRYRFEIAALDWEVEFDLETARLSVEATEARLTSDFLVPDGGLVLRKLRVNGTRLGTTGTAHGALDPCAGGSSGEDDGSGSRTGLIFGRLSRLDAFAVGRFEVTGTDDRCREMEGTIELSAQVR